MQPFISEHVKSMFDDYVKNGKLSSSFMRAVLENDLLNSVINVDDSNSQNIRNIVIFAHMEIPSVCWGSPDKVIAWMAHNGISGLDPKIAGGWYSPKDKNGG